MQLAESVKLNCMHVAEHEESCTQAIDTIRKGYNNNIIGLHAVVTLIKQSWKFTNKNA